jgi:hypothetical protein
MSAANTLIPFNAAYVQGIQTLSLDTTPAYVDPVGFAVLCPSRTHLALGVKSIFTSHMRWPVTLCQPFGAEIPSSNTSDAMPISVISYASASPHRVLPFFLSMANACSMLVGTSMP